MDTGLRERQREQTHLAIRRAALDLVERHGLAALTVQEISRQAGVSPRTFFNHYRSKEEALIPDLPPFRPEAEQAFLDAAEPDLLTALETLLAGHVLDTHDDDGDPGSVGRLVEANPELLPRSLAVYEAFQGKLLELVARRTGRRTDDLVCTVAAQAAIGAVRCALQAWQQADPGSRRPDPAVLRRSFAALRRLASG